MPMTLESSDFASGGAIPRAHTCEGDDLSPALRWSGAPAGARSLALVVDDPDAPDPRAPQRTWVHWVLYDLPPDAAGLPRDTQRHGLPPGTREGKNDWGRTGYGGPCPPIGRHRYFHKLYALDVELGARGALTKAELDAGDGGTRAGERRAHRHLRKTGRLERAGARPGRPAGATPTRRAPSRIDEGRGARPLGLHRRRIAGRRHPAAPAPRARRRRRHLPSRRGRRCYDRCPRMDRDAGTAGGGSEPLTFAALYDELHALARSQARRSRPGHTLNTTALLHEAYLKLAHAGAAEDRQHFFALAARAMRQVLVDHARQQASQKRGAGRHVTTLGDDVAGIQADATEVLAIDAALARLQDANERLARVVELRFFGGLSVEETAEALGTSTATVKRDWRAAHAFLVAALGAGPS